MKDISELDKLFKKIKTTEEKISTLDDLLDTLGDVEDKKRVLWKEIYQNAVIDRQSAGMLFTEAYRQMQAGSTEHVSLGPTLVKYLERMCKSNEQILKLCELITKCEEHSSKIDPDDLFSKIDGG